VIAVERFVAELKKRGVEWMATLCGHGLDPLFHAAKQAGLRLVDTRNEQAAGYAAEAYGRLTRRPGVCAVSSGIAHVNALTGVANAWFDGAPMLLISGGAALRTAGMGHFQDMDQTALAAPVTRFSRTIDHPARVTQLLDEAWQAAHEGPAHLMFPMDVQRAEAPEEEMVRPAGPPRRRALGARADLGAALAKCERPLIVAGSGVFYACAGERLVAFAERFSIPLVVPIWDRGSVERPSPAFMGVLGAASGGPRLLEDADCILMAGAVSDYRTGYLQTNTPVVWLEEFDGLEAPRSFESWLPEAQSRRDRFRAEVRRRGEEQAAQGTHAIHILEAIRPHLDEAVLLIDGGSVGQWAHQLLADRYPGRWLTCGRSGVVGWGLGGAMGARLAYPELPIILLSGDGAFTFTVAELECAVRQRLPFVAVVADDQGWGITRTGHVKQFGEAISSSLGPIAFDKLAEALGARGVVAATPGRIASELKRAIAERIVMVIHVPVVGGNPA
jgi:acetolactate synthase-1/2/3 large subunit